VARFSIKTVELLMGIGSRSISGIKRQAESAKAINCPSIAASGAAVSTLVGSGP
jgi:hypothetical protein